jgi:putative membrane-bound dehydrogenase-like protein
MRCRLVAIILLLHYPLLVPAQQKVMEPGPKSPDEALKTMKPRQGFKIELMASEPLVKSPIAFAWGPDGKFWVVEMGDYPLGVDGKGKPGGRIKFLEKTKGDGPYDKVTVFMDNLPFPTGVFPWGKGVLVTCAPDIFYAEDTDGDGKADKKIVLYTGFVEGNQQHRVNGLVWGLDNWIYGANGDSGGIIKPVHRTDGKRVSGKAVNISGRDFKIKPDEGLIDAVTGQSQYGRCRDDWGNWFGCNNSNPLYHYVLEDHYLRRNPFLTFPNPKVNVSVTPGAARVYPISKTLPRFNSPESANHFTSACSAIIYRDDLFGPEFVNNTFVSEPVHNLIHREIMTSKGVTFTSKRAADEQKSEFLASSDNWFRPTMIQTGPDGALWVADMYRYVIEHPQWIPLEWQKKLDLRAGHDKGRIYRIYPDNKKPRPIPRLDKLSTKELVAALDSPNGWQRDMAQMMLVKGKDGSSVPPLERVFLENKRPTTRLQALATLDGLDLLQPDLLEKGLQDLHAGVRGEAARITGHVRRLTIGLVTTFLKLEEDPDPHVRMRMAYTLGNLEESGKSLGRLAVRNHKDSYLLAAVLSSVNVKNLGAMLVEVRKQAKGPPPPEVVGKLLVMASAVKEPWQFLRLLEGIAAPEDSAYRPSQFAALAPLLDALDRRNMSLAKMWADGDDRLKKTLKEVEEIFAAARKLATDSTAKSPEKKLAVALLGRGLDRQKEDMQTLAGLLKPQTADDLQAAAVATLGSLKDPAVPSLMLKNWKSYAPGLRNQVLDVLLARPEWVTATLDALEKKQVKAREIDAARRQRLLEHKSPAVRTRAAKLLAGAVNPDRRKIVEMYLAKIKDSGDPAAGAKIFTRTCAACHKLGGIGQQVGPDLASVPDKSTRALLTAILDPNFAVEARYVSYTAVTKNGLNLNGLLASETGTSITLVGADGKPKTILRTDLETLFSNGKSVMPEGLEKDVSMKEMADLLAFVRKPGGKKKNEECRIERFRDDATGSVARARNDESDCEMWFRIAKIGIRNQ